MSVLIKGMEMPKSCYTCPFCDYVSARCDAIKGTPYTPTSRYEVRADWCPLVPIPPHGRLIDADEFLKRAIGTKCFRGDLSLMLEELVGESTTIIEAKEDET